ncbi:Myb DNA-bind 3 domain-containing protein [Citrus sinensis]|nr:Myb DNA-bind 3 domain-containing protein [Citrus sinensis]
MALQPPKSRFWTLEEDIKLVESLFDFYHDGKFYADNNFKSSYLRALETTLETKLPGCDIKAKPHIELGTLNMQFRIIHEMLTRPNCSGFDWDPEKKIVRVEKVVWDAYVLSHKGATNFKNKAFPYYENLCMIYGKDHAIGKNAEAPADVSEELGELKELTTLIVAQMKDTSNVVTTTQIARDSTALNVFYTLCDEDRETWVKIFLDGEI